MMPDLAAFIRESNRIEGIHREPTEGELAAHKTLLAEHAMSVKALERFVADVAGRPLRDKPGMDVRVGSHFPPPGGPSVRTNLEVLVMSINEYDLTPFETHVAYETLHPFLDGNGRSGRALWAWQMRHGGFGDPFALGFLHRFYYQSLDESREVTVYASKVAAPVFPEIPNGCGAFGEGGVSEVGAASTVDASTAADDQRASGPSEPASDPKASVSSPEGTR